MSGKTILITPLSTVLAHATRSMMLASELGRRGHNVVMAGDPKYLADARLVDTSACHYSELRDWDLEEGLKIFRDIRKTVPFAFLDELVQEELRVLDEIHPDIVVADFRLTMFVSARVRRIPIVSLVESRWLHDHCVKPWRAFRPYEIYFWLHRLLGEALTERVMLPMQRGVIQLKILPVKKLFTRYGLPRPRHLWNLYEGNFNLLLDTQSWSPTKPLPENFQQVGPIYWTPELPMPTWVEMLDRNRPILYLTLGSTGHVELFQRLFELLGNTHYQVVVTTGGQIDLSKVKLPPNIFVEKYLNGQKIAELADLVIHHGGTGTAYQAIRALAPAIVIATHAEQQFLGESTEDTGMGVWMTMNEVLRNPRLVLMATEQLLQEGPQRRANIQRLKEDLDRYDPVSAAADWIERWLDQAPL